jgi:tyrosyl-tRNA synthetase
MILQAYDFVELHKRENCVLQMGGSDQWGNIVNGIELGRRMRNAHLFALTSPLITTASGAKMGKTAAGAVWLNPDLLSPYDYWQYWRNTEDSDVVRFLKLFTVLPLDEIARLAALKGQDLNEAKKILATEATTLVHGRAAAEQAADTARRTFEEGTFAEALPSVDVARAGLDKGVGVLNAFVQAGLVSSTSEARRQIKAGGLKVNDKTVADERPHAARRHQIIARQEKARAAQAGLEIIPAQKIEPGARQRLGSAKALLSVLLKSGPLSRNSKILRNMPGAIAEIGLTRSTGWLGGPSTA